MTGPFPSPALRVAVTARFGEVPWTFTGRHHADSRVWRVDAEPPVVVKQHGTPRKARQEVAALSRWTPRLAEAGHAVPVLLHAWPDLGALAMTFLPGDEADRAPPADPEAVHRAVGALAAALHRLPVPQADPVPLPEAIRRRLAASSEGAAPALPPALLARARRRVGDGSAFAGVPRVPCHRDLQPRNWLVGDHVAVIDWEHAAPDAALVDLARLAAGPWSEAPGLRAAFLEGYGRDLRPDEIDRLQRLVVLHGLATAAWALRHGDEAFLDAGRAILTRD